MKRHLETATEYNLLFSLPKITASQYSLTRAISDHLTIRSSCVPGCNVVAEGGQSWCGTRNLKTFNKKNENSRCTSTLPRHCTPPIRGQPKVKAYLLGRETRDTGAKKKSKPTKGNEIELPNERFAGRLWNKRRKKLSFEESRRPQLIQLEREGPKKGTLLETRQQAS